MNFSHRKWQRFATTIIAASAIAMTLLPVLDVDAAPAAITFVDYAQCSNDPPPSTSLACPGAWINGILQKSNSHYREGDVTPQRAEVTVAKGAAATGHTIRLRYEARKAAIHAYDSLARWNLTQSAADRCQ